MQLHAYFMFNCIVRWYEIVLVRRDRPALFICKQITIVLAVQYCSSITVNSCTAIYATIHVQHTRTQERRGYRQYMFFYAVHTDTVSTENRLSFWMLLDKYSDHSDLLLHLIAIFNYFTIAIKLVKQLLKTPWINYSVSKLR